MGLADNFMTILRKGMEVHNAEIAKSKKKKAVGALESKLGNPQSVLDDNQNTMLKQMLSDSSL